MANETTTTTANDTYFASFVDRNIREEQRPWSVMRPLLAQAGPHPALVYNWPTQTDPGAAADITEGVPLTNTALSTGVASATIAQNGMLATVTDLLSSVQYAGGSSESWFAEVLARSVKEEFEVTAAALLGGGSNTTGTSGSDLTLAQWAEAVNQLEGRDVVGPLCAVLHPVQLGDLRSGSGNTPGGILPGYAANQTGMEFVGSSNFKQTIMDDLGNPQALAGHLLGVDIYVTSAVATANSGADRAGAIFRKGSALGVYWASNPRGGGIWDMMTETHRALDLPGTQIAVTSAYGVAEILDREIESVITDA